MGGIDSLLQRARKRLSGNPADPIVIKRETLGTLVDEIDKLRAATHDLTANTVGLSRGQAAETSKRAALSVKPRTGTQRMRVLSAICATGVNGATDEELIRDTAMNANTLRPRRVELVSGGWVVDSGRRRKTQSNEQAIVWVATDKALAALKTI